MKNSTLAVLMVLLAPVFAFAQTTGVDFSTVTSSVSFAGVAVAILAVLALKVPALIAMWGGKKALASVK